MASTFKNAVASGVGITTVDIYTVPASTATTVIGLSLANKLAVATTVSATMTKGGTAVYIIKDAALPAGAALVLFGGDQKLVLQTTDKISVITNTAASTDVILSFLEIA